MAPIQYTTGMIAHALGGQLIGRADLAIGDVAGLEQAGPTSLSFIRSGKYAAMWTRSRAPAAIVTRGVDVPGHDPAARALIVVENADLAMIKLLEIAAQALPLHAPTAGTHPAAIVDPSAKIAPSARIGAGSVVGPRSVIGEGVVVMPRVTIGADVVIGAGTILHPGVVIYDRCRIGAQCLFHGNVVIGADGFGFVPDPQGRGVIKVPHIGTVEIGNGVEIGSCSCVDRGKFGATRIGDGTKIDNLVQVGHNCDIGRSVLICGTTGIGGSVSIGDGVVIGGCTGVVDNVKIGAGARIGAKTGVLNNVPAGETWTGLPACPHRQQMRTWAAVRKLPDVLRALKRESNVSDVAGTHLRDLEL